MRDFDSSKDESNRHDGMLPTESGGTVANPWASFTHGAQVAGGGAKAQHAEGPGLPMDHGLRADQKQIKTTEKDEGTKLAQHVSAPMSHWSDGETHEPAARRPDRSAGHATGDRDAFGILELPFTSDFERAWAPFKAASAQGRAGASARDAVHASEAGLGGTGKPAGAGRAANFVSEMEQVFGENFSDVRISYSLPEQESHRGAQATAGENHIAVDPAAVDLNSERGKHILAHEFAHIVQKRRGTVTPDAVDAQVDPVGAGRTKPGRNGSAENEDQDLEAAQGPQQDAEHDADEARRQRLEDEAERAAERAVRGESVHIQSGARAPQRQFFSLNPIKAVKNGVSTVGNVASGVAKRATGAVQQAGSLAHAAGGTVSGVTRAAGSFANTAAHETVTGVGMLKDVAGEVSVGTKSKLSAALGAVAGGMKGAAVWTGERLAGGYHLAQKVHDSLSPGAFLSHIPAVGKGFGTIVNAMTNPTNWLLHPGEQFKFDTGLVRGAAGSLVGTGKGLYGLSNTAVTDPLALAKGLGATLTKQGIVELARAMTKDYVGSWKKGDFGAFAGRFFTDILGGKGINKATEAIRGLSTAGEAASTSGKAGETASKTGVTTSKASKSASTTNKSEKRSALVETADGLDFFLGNFVEKPHLLPMRAGQALLSNTNVQAALGHAGMLPSRTAKAVQALLSNANVRAALGHAGMLPSHMAKAGRALLSNANVRAALGHAGMLPSHMAKAGQALLSNTKAKAGQALLSNTNVQAALGHAGVLPSRMAKLESMLAPRIAKLDKQPKWVQKSVRAGRALNQKLTRRLAQRGDASHSPNTPARSLVRLGKKVPKLIRKGFSGARELTGRIKAVKTRGTAAVEKHTPEELRAVAKQAKDIVIAAGELNLPSAANPQEDSEQTKKP